MKKHVAIIPLVILVPVLLVSSSAARAAFPLFRAAVDSDAGEDPVSVAEGDFDEDGNVDLAVVNSSTSQVQILLGQGDGTFESSGSLATGLYPSCVLADDFDADGHLDLIAACSADYVSTYHGYGDGTFNGLDDAARC